MQTVIGLFERYENADLATEERRRRDLSNQHLSVLAHESAVRERLSALASESEPCTRSWEEQRAR